jgi:regulator of sigma E protease
VSIFVAVAGLLLLVLIHEAGHFLAAKGVGMRATRFMVGFPPTILRYRRGDTEYGLGLIPLGGFVRIPGMTKPRPVDLDVIGETARRLESEPMEAAWRRATVALDADDPRDILPSLADLRAAVEAERPRIDPERLEWCERELDRLAEEAHPRGYWRQPVWKRVVVIGAGPFANVLAAFVILVVFSLSGAPHFIVGQSVDQVGTGSVAHAMGLKHGDKVVAVDGRSTHTSQQVRNLIQTPGPVTLSVKRQGTTVKLGPATPTDHSGGRRILGFTFALQRTGTEHAGLVGSVKSAAVDMRDVTTGTLDALAHVFNRQTQQQFTTPVGIVQQSGTTINEGVYPRVLALISLSLAIFNLLPFLPLDGGHLLFALIELVRRRPVRREIYERVSALGIVAMLMLFVIGLTNDVGRIANGPTIK